jgi:hypothetical protein
MDDKLNSERKFLHDLASPLTIAKAHIKKVLLELQDLPPDEHQRMALERSQKVLDTLLMLEDLHASRRLEIHQLETKEHTREGA